MDRVVQEEGVKFPILIVEDEPVSRKLLEKTLTKAGYEVVSTKDGCEAMRILERDFFPIVITDWIMPKMDGVELCRAIRNSDFSGYIFIILLTVKDSQDDIIAGLKAGADEYLTKPFNHAELLARLNTGKRILELERSLKEANGEIKRLSFSDFLTGAYNWRYLIDRLPQEIKRAIRYNHPLSLVMCDIDFFKKVNDLYGHQAGNVVLKEFVNCIRESIRDGVDWLVRYGGEEFLVVVPETGLEGATVLAKRLRLLVSEMVVNANENLIGITASFGVTCFDPSQHYDSVSPESLIREVDECLYQAKKEGRNRVKTVADKQSEPRGV